MKITCLTPWCESEVHTSQSKSDKVEFLKEMLNIGRCSKDTPYEITGKMKHLTRSATSIAILSEMMESVETGRCAPCCSSEPTGIITMLVLLRDLRNP